MTCSRCGAQVTVDRASYCARCLLIGADADAEAPVVSADEAPPCDLLSIMGETSRAITFLAEQTWPVRRLVAFKLFKTELPQPRVPRHPNIAPVLETGRIGTRRYVMTPYLAGGTLPACANRHRLDVSARMTALLAVIEGLAFAHGRGVSHGRISASNVLCEPHPPFVVQIVDFSGTDATASADSRAAVRREDLHGVLELAEVLLPPAGGRAVDVSGLLRELRLSARSAEDLKKGFGDLHARITSL